MTAIVSCPICGIYQNDVSIELVQHIKGCHAAGCQEAIAIEREGCLMAVAAEAEFPGEMPEEGYTLAKKQRLAALLQATVRVTKEKIDARIRGRKP